MIQKATAPAEAKVTESALVAPSGIGQPREIDTLIETAVGPYRIVIAVEAKRHRRKLNSILFESIAGKYFVEGGVRVNKVVVVTRNGFTKPVIERAQSLGVELLTLKEAKSADWSRFRPFSSSFKTLPQVRNIAAHPPIPGHIAEAAAQRGRIVCAHGDRGSAFEFALRVLFGVVFRDHIDMVRKADEIAAGEPGGKTLHVDMPLDHPHVIRVDGTDLPLERFIFDVHFSKPHAATPIQPGNLFFQIAPHICSIELNPAISGATPEEICAEGRIVCGCCDRDYGSIREWAHKLVFEESLPRDPSIAMRFQQELSQSPIGQAWLTLDFKEILNRAVRFRSTDNALTSARITVHAVAATGQIESTDYELADRDGGEKFFTHLKAAAGGKKIDIVIPHSDAGPPEKIVLKLGDSS
ncbi:MAG TPA: hypothetical protein VMF30_11785 [Pirellulales bacterium]|nr:hypothetical protein [Pirellulales bacterium]